MDHMGAFIFLLLSKFKKPQNKNHFSPAMRILESLLCRVSMKIKGEDASKTFNLDS